MHRVGHKALAIFLISITFARALFGARQLYCSVALFLRRCSFYSIQFSACLYDLSFSVHFVVNSTFYTIFTTIHRLTHMPASAAAAAAIATSSNHAARRKRNVKYTHKKGSEVRRRGGGMKGGRRGKKRERTSKNNANVDGKIYEMNSGTVYRCTTEQ